MSYFSALVSAVINALGGEQTNKNIDSEKIELAIEILNEALKANVGGSIKQKIEDAFKIMPVNKINN